MATVIGEAARYTTAQSIRIFQRMLLTTMIVIVAIGFFDGAVLTEVVLRWGHLSWLFLGLAGLGAAGAFYVCRYQSARIDQYEKERVKWRKGAEGERITAGVLETLPDDYWVINDVSTRAGNMDHVVIGPTGVYAIETKNWRGIVSADGNGELLLNGKPSSTPHVRTLINRIMTVRDAVLALTQRDDLFIKGLMVFPKARVDARFGQTSTVNCLTEGSLCTHIEHSKVARKLDDDEIEKIVRAFKGIAGMDVGFSEAATTTGHRTKSDGNLAERRTVAP